MNKKIYNAPKSKVVMIENMQVIAESISMYDAPAENSMESKSISNGDFEFDIDWINE